TGSYAAQFTATTNAGSLAYARQNFLAAQTDLLVTADVNVGGEGASGGSVPLLDFYDPGGAKLLSLYRMNATGTLAVDHSGSSHTVTGILPLNTWMSVKVHALIRGSGAVDLVEIWTDGTLAYTVDTANLGTGGTKT